MTEEVTKALNVCAQARLTLAGKRKGHGFWQMPHGAPFVRACWQQNMARARRLLALAAAASGGDVKQAPGEAPQSGGDSRNARKPTA